MKTNMVVSRELFNFKVSQRTKDGYFDAGDLLYQWNRVEGNTVRKMARYLESPKTKEFIEALKADSTVVQKCTAADFQPVIIGRGKHLPGENTKDVV